ncbi:MAG: ABC transporter substrate-binding protein [Firmicutes bacterium]|nr:ABC transporter substrate-binding protein [Bacillota bacterium]
MKKFVKVLCASVMALSMVACSSPSEPAKESGLTKVTLMLDYTPNTNHTGFYVAKEKGYYEEAGLDVEIIEPGDNATTTMVATGKANFGVSYQEDTTYALTAEESLPIKAIAAIIQHNTSGFVSLKGANINSPKDFAGKTYAGWGAPSEEAVIEAVMKKDGADIKDLTIVGADGSGFASLSEEAGKGKVNIQWEFYGWAVMQGLMDGYDLNYLACNDLDARLDYYTPLVITNNDMIENNADTVKAFMQATKKGYEYAIDNAKEAAQILHDVALSDVDLEFLTKSQEYLSEQYAKDASSWGIMKDEVWDNYTEFMYEYGLIDHTIEAKEQYTNAFVE